MIISCPECTTKFSIADAVLGERGRKVRCYKCGHTWHQTPENAAPAAPPPPLVVEPMEVAPRRPAQPLMPPTSTAGETSVPLESEPSGGVERAPVPPMASGELPMDSEVPGAAAKPADDFEIPNIAPPDDPFAIAATPSADDASSFNTVDVDSLLNRSAEDIPKVFAKRMRAEEKKSGFGGIIFLLLGGLVAALWFGRMQVVERFPEAARLYKAVGVPIEVLGDGLEFRGVASEMVKEGKTSVLLVRGVIANVVTGDRPVPLLRLVLLDTGGGVIQEAFAKPRKDSLAGGAQIGFQVRMEDPSAAAVRYEITFAEAPAKASAAPAAPSAPPTAPPSGDAAK